MKKILLASISLALTIGFYACKKNSDVTSTPSTINGLTASKTKGVKSSEPVTFAFNSSRSATNAVIWKVMPTSSVAKSIHGSKATFNFGNPGKYIVTASDGVTIDTLLINVDSSYYTGIDTTIYLPKDSAYYCQAGDTLSLPISTNDQLSIKPSLTEDSFGNAFIQFAATTSQTYPSTSPTLITNYAWGDTTNVGVNYTGVFFYPNTLTLTAPSVATSIYNFYIPTGHILPLLIGYNNKTYTGSVSVVGNKATFTWSYTSGVLISPLVITR